jgi:uncharacterized membrane protein
MSTRPGHLEQARKTSRPWLLRFARHPVLVHVPLALLFCASTADAIALFSDDGSWWWFARATMTWGVILGFPTSLTGLLELVLRPMSSRAFPWLMAHVATVYVALIGYLLSAVMRDEGPPSPATLAIGFGAALLLLAGAGCGSMLVLGAGKAQAPSRQRTRLEPDD